MTGKRWVSLHPKAMRLRLMAGRKRDDSKSMAKKALIRKKIRPHVIRHTFATTLLDNGNDLKTVQALMGHSHIRTTESYLHSTDDRKVEAIQTLQFGTWVYSRCLYRLLREYGKRFEGDGIWIPILSLRIPSWNIDCSFLFHSTRFQMQINKLCLNLYQYLSLTSLKKIIFTTSLWVFKSFPFLINWFHKK